MSFYSILLKSLSILEPGEVEFAQSAYVVKESHGTLEIECNRNNGASGQISVSYKASSDNENSNSFEGFFSYLNFMRFQVLNS